MQPGGRQRSSRANGDGRQSKPESGTASLQVAAVTMPGKQEDRWEGQRVLMLMPMISPGLLGCTRTHIRTDMDVPWVRTGRRTQARGRRWMAIEQSSCAHNCTKEIRPHA